MGTTTSKEENNSNESEKKEIIQHLNNHETQRNVCSADVNDCNRVKYFMQILDKYGEMDLNKLDDNTSKLFEDIVKILNVFHHFLCLHNTDKDFKMIHDKVNLCSANNCDKLSRNNRNRHTARNNNQMQQMYHTTNVQLISKLQILDKIHCYYSHLDHISPDDEKQINGNYHNSSNKFHQLLSDPIQNKFGLYQFGHEFCYDITYKRDDGHLGRFFSVDNNDQILINPKYTNLKQELTENKICTISIEQYNNEYHKAVLHFNSAYRKSNYHNPVMSDNIVTGKQLMDSNQIHLTIQHILSLIIYANYDILQSQFTKTYYSNIQNHNQFYYLGKTLKSVMQPVGQPYADALYNAAKYSQPKLKLYHGISEELIFPAYLDCVVFSPLSTTLSGQVATRFTNYIGVIIQFSINEYHNGHYLSIDWLSDYPQEKEHLFVQSGFHLPISNIIQVQLGYEYDSLLKALFIIHTLLINKTWDGVVTENIRILIVAVVQHQLSQKLPHKYNKEKYEFKSLNEYGRTMVNTFFEKQTYFEIRYLHWVEKHNYLKELLFDDNLEWIKMEEFYALFPNICNIDIWNNHLCSGVFNDILTNYSKKSVQSITFQKPSIQKSYSSVFSYKSYSQLYGISNELKQQFITQGLEIFVSDDGQSVSVNPSVDENDHQQKLN